MCTTVVSVSTATVSEAIVTFSAQGLERYVIRDVAYKPGCPVAIIEESQPLEVTQPYTRICV